MATEPTDQELVAEVRRGSQHAMASLYDRYARSMYSLALYMLRDARGAEDVVQDVFLTFWQHPESYVSERGPLGPWLLRVTRNRAIDILRRRGREQHPDEERVAALEERVVDPDPEPGEQVWSRE
ncbi:MAG: sigma-70 family RNA polymerase sigma factor, partial [Thermomicrobiaceae bacterium]|nr:sigma-70 family RNA polymerase sigma factor [Thermomicrobiaceae bacterium]